MTKAYMTNLSALQPALVGQLLRIDPTRAADHDDVYAAASDPSIWEQHPARDRWKREVFDAFFAGGLKSGGALTVRDVVTNEVIGSSRYYSWSPEGRHLSIGYTFLVRRCWGGTYNHELKKLMLDHALGFVDRVWFHIGANNLRSRRAIEAIGAVFDKEIANDPDWNGVSMAYYVIDQRTRKI
jgi:RimJ/RimL family protein N-acetyltransferase